MRTRLRTLSEFDSHLTFLSHELFDANVHFHLSNSLRQALSEYNREIQRSPTFWGYTIEAHVDATLLHLCRVYDSHSSSINLTFLLETVRGNPEVFCKEAFKTRLSNNPSRDDLATDFGQPDVQQLERAIAFCKGSDLTVRTLREWRNKVIAHRRKDMKLDLTEFKREWPLRSRDVEKLVDEGFSILNHCGKWYKATSYCTLPPSNGVEDYKLVFEKLKG